MTTKTLSNNALSVIDRYLHFMVETKTAPEECGIAGGPAVCSVPYFNNKVGRMRGALRVHIGKGSPDDIRDEISAIAVRQHIDVHALADESLKKLLVDNNLGIECSGFAYYVLNAESQTRLSGELSKNLDFVNCSGWLDKARCYLRPVENCDVATLADDRNSALISTKDVQPGDVITMIAPDNAPISTSEPASFRDHIMVIHQVEYENNVPKMINYSHAVAYPDDGLYGTGVRQGQIEMIDPGKSITEARWVENGKEGSINLLHLRAMKMKTEIRRLRWFGRSKLGIT